MRHDARMAHLLSPSEIEDRAQTLGLSIPDFCRIAGVANTTFYRWKNGEHSPRIDIYQRFVNATEPPTTRKRA